MTTLPPDEFFDEFGGLLEVLKTPSLPVKAVLLNDNDSALQQELQRRVELHNKEKAEKENEDDSDVMKVGVLLCVVAKPFVHS